MDFTRLSELLFPDVTETPEDIEKRYPPRVLPEGAKVTRFAPSPTGFVHFGGLFPSRVCERLAHQSDGVFYLRIEDTDNKREVEGAAEGLIRTLERYGIIFDEGAVIKDDGTIGSKGAYGPYRQSERVDIYHVFAKDLVKRGLAYPCFTTDEELEELNASDKKTEIKNKEWTADAQEKMLLEQEKQRSVTLEEVEDHLAAGHKFVLRMLAKPDPEKKLRITDLIKGPLELPQNDKDEVLLKSNGVPTYHFAHAVDDHLMGTTHVIRGEEWLPSLPRHAMLFEYLGFKLPKYMHIAQIMRLDEEGNKKKLSKRDMGANLDDYSRMGYSPECVNEYIMTLLNSNYEEWRAANPDKEYTDFPFSIKKMSTSGCLFDFDKLNDVSKNVLSKKTADEIYDAAIDWANAYDPDFAALLGRDPDYSKKILAIGRGGKKPRKDITTYAELPEYMSFFFDETFGETEPYPDGFDKNDIKRALSAFLESYDPADDQNVWFDKIKAITESIGYCPDMKEYKSNPDAYPGNVADVSMFLRVAVTGKMNSPDMYAVMNILGENKVRERIERKIEEL